MCSLTFPRLTTKRLSVGPGEKDGSERLKCSGFTLCCSKKNGMAMVFWLVNLHESKTCSPYMSLSFGGDVIKHIHFNLKSLWSFKLIFHS